MTGGTKVSQDPIENAIRKGIIRGIQVALENRCYRAALILVYSGIDAMANLERPERQVEVKPKDFISWVRRYIKIDAKGQITPEEFYGARCGLLHMYGVESRETRKGSVRKVAYTYDMPQVVQYNPSISKQLVLIDVFALADAFLRGVDQFVRQLRAEMSASSEKSDMIKARLRKLILVIPGSQVAEQEGNKS